MEVTIGFAIKSACGPADSFTVTEAVLLHPLQLTVTI